MEIQSLEKDRCSRHRRTEEVRDGLAFAGDVVFAVALVVVLAMTAERVIPWVAPSSTSRPNPTDKDTIVLAEFINKTGDTAFDSLKQVLSMQLAQSPFLAPIPSEMLTSTLKQMGRPADDRLTPELTLDLCQRAGATAMVAGSIAALGREYVIGLKAVECRTRDVLVETQADVRDKEAIVKTLGAVATELADGWKSRLNRSRFVSSAGEN